MTAEYYVSLNDYLYGLKWMEPCSYIPKFKLIHGLASEGMRIDDLRNILRVQCREQSEKEQNESMARFIEFLPIFLGLKEEFDPEGVDFFTDEIVEHLIGIVTYLIDTVLPNLGVISEPKI
jgi:hypothetical protein